MRKKLKPTIEIYYSKITMKWYFKIYAPNHKLIAESRFGSTQKRACEKTVLSLRKLFDKSYFVVNIINSQYLHRKINLLED